MIVIDRFGCSQSLSIVLTVAVMVFSILLSFWLLLLMVAMIKL